MKTSPQPRPQIISRSMLCCHGPSTAKQQNIFGFERAADGSADADLALLDKTNPPLGGVELFKRLRARHRMPIIFLSA
jgi:DNA-binding response OmpR family regulator